MNPSQLSLKALPTHEVVKRMAAVAARLWQPNVRIHVDAQTNIGNFTFATNPGDPSIENQLAQLSRFSTEHSFTECVHFGMRIDGAQDSVTYGTPDAVLAYIEIGGPVPRKMEVVEVLREHFDFISSKDLVTRVNPVDHGLAALKLREASVGDLHTQIDKLGSLLATLTQRDVELRRTRVAELDAEYQTRLANFERERAQALERDEQQLQKKQDDLQKQEAALRERVTNFETQESKYVRRDLLKELTKLLDQFGTFALSAPTSSKRTPVFIASLVMAAVFFAIAVIGGYNYFTTLDVHYIPASSAGLLGFSATMLFFVKWSDRWFRQHANEEMQSKRYKADMLRASWIAELTAEWAKDGKVAPPELVDMLSRNLFATQPGVGATEHPVDALLGLMKRAQKLDVSKDRITLESGAPK